MTWTPSPPTGAPWTPSPPLVETPWPAAPSVADAGWTGPPPMIVSWPSKPCTGDAGWKSFTVCRRPYGRGAYGMGPYGRCAVVAGSVWGETPIAPPAPFAPAPQPVEARP